MKISAIRAWKEDLSLTKPYTIAYKTVSSVTSCFVEITAEDGTKGYGAANPSKYVVNEDSTDTLHYLQQADLGRLIGLDIKELGQWRKTIYSLFPNQAGARAALDIGCYDLMTKSLKIPLCQFLGQSIDQLPTSITIGIKSPEDTVEEAQEYIDMGFKCLKVKLGNELEEDVEKVRRLREKWSSSILIRVDANQGYTLAELKAFMDRAKDWELELIEQPLPVQALDPLTELIEEERSILAADESLVHAKDAFYLAQRKLFGIFNIKMMKCGGISEACRIAEIARAAGISLMWGCNDESRIGISAALHTAFSFPHTRFIDLDGSLDLASDIAKEGFILEEGLMRPVMKPGLGVVVEC